MCLSIPESLAKSENKAPHIFRQKRTPHLNLKGPPKIIHTTGMKQEYNKADRPAAKRISKREPMPDMGHEKGADNR